MRLKSLPVKYRVYSIAIFSILMLCTFIWFIKDGSMHSNTLLALSEKKENIFYCNSSNLSQSLDIYHPKSKSNEKVPLVVYVHGGGWRSGNKKNKLISIYTPLFIKQGLAVVSVDYRLTSAHPYPDQNNDIACALSYLNENADQLKINTDKLILFGDSAGGQLAAFAALNIPYQNYDYKAPVGVIDFYGVSDFSKIINGATPDFNARRYLGSKYNQVTAPASPITYVTKKAPRFLFVHGTNDRVVPISQSKSLYDRLIKSGIDADYVTINGARHGFLGPELPKGDYETIQASLISFLQEAVK